MLATLAVLAEEPVPASFLTAAAEDADAARDAAAEPAEQLVARLAELGLASVTEAGVTLPQDVRAAVIGELSGDERRAQVQRAAALLATAFPPDAFDFRTWDACALLEPHAHAVIAQARALDAAHRDALRLLDRLSLYTLYRGDVMQAHELIEPAVPFADVALADDDPLRADLRTTLGETLNELRDYQEAQRVLKEALALHERILGEDDPRPAVDRVRLGMAFEGAGDAASGRAQLDRAVTTLELISPRSREHLLALEYLGWVMYSQDEPDAAYARLGEALALASEHFGPAHPETAGVRSMLGAVLQKRNEGAAAKAELTRAVADQEAVLRSDHPELAVTRSNLSDALRHVGDAAGAKVQIELSLAAAERAFPPNHLAIWLRHSKLAAVLTALGDHDGALAHQEQALRITERSVGLADARGVRDLAAVGAARAAAGDSAGARAAYEQALDLGSRSAGAEELPLAVYARSLVAVTRELGDLSGALRAGVRALELSRAADDEALVIASRLSIASLIHALQADVAGAYETLGFADRATAARDESRAVLDALLDEGIMAEDVGTLLAAGRAAVDAGSLDRARTAAERAGSLLPDADAGKAPAATRPLSDLWGQLGRALVGQRAWEDAWHAFEQELELLRALPEPRPQSVGVVLHDLANVRRGEERWEEAVELYRQAADSKREADYPADLAITLRALGVALARCRRFDEAEDALQQRLDLLHRLPRPDPTGVGLTLHDLADLRRLRGREAEAIALYRQAATNKRTAGRSRDLATTLQALGRTLENVDRGEEEAASVFEEQLDVLGSLPDAHPSELGYSLHDLASARFAQGRVSEAIDDFKRAVEQLRKADDRRSLSITLHALGRALVDDGRVDEATAAFEERLELLRALPDSNPQQIGVTLHDLADLQQLQGRRQEAVALYEQAVEHKRRGDRPLDLTATLHALGLAHEALRQYEEAAAAYEEELAILRGLPDPDLRRISVVLHDLAVLRFAQGRADDAVALAEQTAEEMRAADEPIALVTALHALGVVLARAERLDEAEPVLQERLELLRQLPGTDAGLIGVALHDLADVQQLRGRRDEAIALYEQAAVQKRKSRTSNDLAVTLHMLARALEELDRQAEAEAAYQERLELLQARPNPEPRELSVTLTDLGDVSRAQGRMEDALARYQQATDLLRSLDDSSSAGGLTIALRPMGRTLMDLGRREEADAVFQEELARMRADPDADRRQVGVTLHDLADVRRARGRWDEAVALYREAAAHKRGGDRPRDLAVTLDALGHALGHQQHWADAAAAFQEALELLRALPEPEPESVAAALTSLAEVEVAQQQLDAAIDLHRQAVREARAGGVEVLLSTLGALGRTLQIAGRHDEAEVTYDEQIGIMRRADADPLTLALALHPLADLRLAQGRPDEALELYREATDLVRGADDPGALEYMLFRTGRAFRQMGRVEEARLAFEEQLELLHRAADAEPQQLGIALHDLADLHRIQGRHEQAAGLYEESARHKRQADDRVDLATTLYELASTSLVLRRYDAARTSAAEAVELLQGPWQAEGPTLARALLLHAQASVDDPAAALELLAQARREIASSEGPGAQARARELVDVADAYEHLAHVEIARMLRRRAAAALDETSVRQDDPVALMRVSDACAGVGALDEAWAALERATPVPEADAQQAVVRGAATGWFSLGRRLAAAGDLERAQQALETSAALAGRLAGRDPVLEGATLHCLGDVARAQGRVEEAVAHYGQAVEAAAEGSMAAAVSLHARGRALLSLERLAEAASDFEAVRAILADEQISPGTVLHDLAKVRLQQGRLDESLALFGQAVASKRERKHLQGLAYTLCACAAAMHRAGDVVAARAATDEAARLLRAGWSSLVTTMSRRELPLLAASVPWPDGEPAARERADIALPPSERLAMHARVLLARLALGPQPPDAAMLLDGLELDGDDVTLVEAGVARSIAALDGAATRRRRDAARRGVLATVEAAADADPSRLLALAIACVDVGERDRGEGLLERVQSDDADDGVPAHARVDDAQLALAWLWSGTRHEQAGELRRALTAYERSASLLAGRSATVRSAALGCVVEVLRELGEQDEAHERAVALPWCTPAAERDVRIVTLMRLARRQALLGEPLAGRASLAMAAVNLRLAQPPRDAAERPIADVDAAGADSLAALSASAAALLELLRGDEAAAAELMTEPGSTAPPDAAWEVLGAVHELTSAGLVRSDSPLGWFALTARGRAVSAVPIAESE